MYFKTIQPSKRCVRVVSDAKHTSFKIGYTAKASIWIQCKAIFICLISNKKGPISRPFFGLCSTLAYSAKIVTLLLKTSTVPPFTSKRCSFPAPSFTRTIPFFSEEIRGAWLFKTPRLPSLPGRKTKLPSPSKSVASGVMISTFMCFYLLVLTCSSFSQHFLTGFDCFFNGTLQVES